MGAVGRSGGEDGHGAACRTGRTTLSSSTTRAGGGAKLILDYDVSCRRSCVASEWSATYFAGTALAGAPLAVQCLTELNETLSPGVSPAAGVPSSDYSARFTKTIDEGAGTYVFSLFHDDGVRLFVDGEVVFDAWEPSGGWYEKTVTVPLADGPHDVVVEYYQGGGGAKLILDYERLGGDIEASGRSHRPERDGRTDSLSHSCGPRAPRLTSRATTSIAAPRPA